jgi:hypothetical protein
MITKSCKQPVDTFSKDNALYDNIMGTSQPQKQWHTTERFEKERERERASTTGHLESITAYCGQPEDPMMRLAVSLAGGSNISSVNPLQISSSGKKLSKETCHPSANFRFLVIVLGRQSFVFCILLNQECPK